MAIDFSQVKAITIPEGSVTKITDSTGNTLWQGAGWHTVFEGSFNHSWSNGSSRPIIKICDLVASDKPLKLRITGSINTTFYRHNIDLAWIGESVKNFDEPNLPLIINKETTQTATGVPSSNFRIILNCHIYRYNNYDSEYTYFYLQVNANSNEFRFNLIDTTHMENYTASLNITKVEHYY